LRLVWKLYGCFLKWWYPIKSSILIGFTIINHLFLGTTISGNPRIYSLQSRAPSAGRYLRRLSKMAGANAADRTSGIKSKGVFRGFHSHGGTPTAGWFISWKILIKMDDN
jgi:hypothetical protein